MGVFPPLEIEVINRTKMPTFKNRAYFSITSLVLNDVNVRESNVINRHSRSQYLSEVKTILAIKEKLNLKTMYAPFIVVSRFLKHYSALPYFVKIFIFNPGGNIYSV